ncbi:hypothetical protein BDW60DRAFT_207077 [Aspergillus nidulans var. acristatus]
MTSTLSGREEGSRWRSFAKHISRPSFMFDGRSGANLLQICRLVWDIETSEISVRAASSRPAEESNNLTQRWLIRHQTSGKIAAITACGIIHVAKKRSIEGTVLESVRITAIRGSVPPAADLCNELLNEATVSSCPLASGLSGLTISPPLS